MPPSPLSGSDLPVHGRPRCARRHGKLREDRTRTRALAPAGRQRQSRQPASQTMRIAHVPGCPRARRQPVDTTEGGHPRPARNYHDHLPPARYHPLPPFLPGYGQVPSRSQGKILLFEKEKASGEQRIYTARGGAGWECVPPRDPLPSVGSSSSGPPPRPGRLQPLALLLLSLVQCTPVLLPPPAAPIHDSILLPWLFIWLLMRRCACLVRFQLKPDGGGEGQGRGHPRHGHLLPAQLRPPGDTSVISLCLSPSESHLITAAPPVFSCCCSLF